VNLVGTNFGGQGFFGASFVFGWYRKHKHFLRISHAKLHSSFCATNRCHIQVTSTAPFCKACCLQVPDICFSYPNRTYKFPWSSGLWDNQYCRHCSCSRILLNYLVQRDVQLFFSTNVRFHIWHGVLLSQWIYYKNPQSAWDLQDQCTFFRTEEVRYRQRDGQAKILGIIFCVLGALLMSIYKGPIIFKRLISKTNPPSSMLPRNNLLMGDLIMGFEGWGIDKWTLGGLCFILQTLSVGIETNLKVNVFPHYGMKNYLN